MISTVADSQSMPSRTLSAAPGRSRFAFPSACCVAVATKERALVAAILPLPWPSRVGPRAWSGLASTPCR
eukprot:1355609-Prorocentrum_lima.AAC.1